MFEDQPEPEDVSAGDGCGEGSSQWDRDEHASNIADAAERSVERDGLAGENVGGGGVGERSKEGGGVGVEDVATVDVRAEPRGRCCHCVG